MPLIKTLSQTLKQDKEKFKVPKSVQQAIPIRKIWPDGIFQVESKYSRTFRFTDINYSIASKADKTEMFLDYSELLNALDSVCTAKITLNNRKINKEEFEQSLLIPMKGDGLDEYRKEYNDMLLSKISGTNNSIYQERYLTISVHKKNIDVIRFARRVAAQQAEKFIDRLSETAVVIQCQAVVRLIARGAFQTLGDFQRVFPAALLQPLAQHRRRDGETDRHQNLSVTFPGQRQVGAGAVGHHVKAGVQPEVDLHANAIVSIVGVPAESKKMLLGAGKKLMFAEGDMILAARVKRAGYVTMGHQQLRVLALAQRRQQAIFTGAGGAHQPNQFSWH